MGFRKILLICGLMSLAQAAHAASGTIEIKITGISICKGSLMLAIYSKESQFLNVEHAVHNEMISLADGCASTMLYKTSIPYGHYAIVIYNDRNSNGILDRNSFGMPVETWGTSNNARPFLREPIFSECVFNHAALHTALTINIH